MMQAMNTPNRFRGSLTGESRQAGVAKPEGRSGKIKTVKQVAASERRRKY
jgi:hypothetical protein